MNRSYDKIRLDTVHCLKFINISFMERQFVVDHTIFKLGFLHYWTVGLQTLSVKMLSTKILLVLIFSYKHNILKC
jgi:hypothetical protein